MQRNGPKGGIQGPPSLAKLRGASGGGKRLGTQKRRGGMLQEGLYACHHNEKLADGAEAPAARREAPKLMNFRTSHRAEIAK